MRLKHFCFSYFLISFLLNLSAGSASAQIKEHFQLMDQNGDGYLSGTELTLLSPIGTAHRGKMTFEEFTAAVNTREIAHRAQWRIVLENRDGNKDEILSGNEISGFEFFDSDQNRRIDETEFLPGIRRIFEPLRTLGYQAIAEKATERFKMMDINQDGRLSGTEATFLDSNDLSGDKRITVEEYVASTLLDVIASEMAPGDAAPQSHDANTSFHAIVSAINRADGQAVIGLCRPEFQSLINLQVINSILEQIRAGNGKLSISSQVQESAGPQPGTKVFTAQVQAERGTIELTVIDLEGKILGVAMNGSAVDHAIPKFLEEMLNDFEGKLTPFAQDCSPACMRMIRRIQAEEDDVAIEMFHPEIAKQIPRETFIEVFNQLRGKVGKYKKIELETAGVEIEADKTTGFVTLSHRVEGTAGIAMVQHKLQIVGFKPHIVSIAIQADSEH